MLDKHTLQVTPVDKIRGVGEGGGAGKVAYGDSHILYRPLSYDQEGEQHNFCQLLDKHTLQVTPVDKIWGGGGGGGVGKVAYGDSHILYRPLSYDTEGEQLNFLQMLDKHTRQVNHCTRSGLKVIIYFHAHLAVSEFYSAPKC